MAHVLPIEDDHLVRYYNGRGVAAMVASRLRAEVRNRAHARDARRFACGVVARMEQDAFLLRMNLRLMPSLFFVAMGMLFDCNLIQFIGYPYPAYYPMLFVCTHFYLALREKISSMIADVDIARLTESGFAEYRDRGYLVPSEAWRLLHRMPVRHHMRIMWYIFRMHGTTSLCSLISLPDSHGYNGIIAYVDTPGYCRLRLASTIVFRVINGSLGDPELSDDSDVTVEGEEHAQTIASGNPYLSPAPEFPHDRMRRLPPSDLSRWYRGPDAARIRTDIAQAQVQGTFLSPAQLIPSPHTLHHIHRAQTRPL